MASSDLVECAGCGFRAAEWEFNRGCPKCGCYTQTPAEDEGDE